jgi:hypothetical protein
MNIDKSIKEQTANSKFNPFSGYKKPDIMSKKHSNALDFYLQ